MAQDQNMSEYNEGRERPSSGWQSASDRRDGGRRFNDRDGGRRFGSDDRREGGRRWDNRDERGRDDRGFRGDRNDRYGSDRGGFRGERDNNRRSEDEQQLQGRKDPFIPESVSAKDLDAESRRSLMSLRKDNAERVARHLVYAGVMMDVDPEVSYEHAQAAYRHASRIDVVREALGLAAYLTGRYSEALRELRTYRRMTDDYSHVAIEADSERGLGRPEKALTFISEIPLARLDADSKVELALVTSGARADAGDVEGGLSVLDKINVENLEEMLQARVQLIRADRLEELGREEEAEELRAKWEPVFSEEGEVDVYEEEVEYDEADSAESADSSDSAESADSSDSAPSADSADEWEYEEGEGHAGSEDEEDFEDDDDFADSEDSDESVNSEHFEDAELSEATDALEETEDQQ